MWRNEGSVYGIIPATAAQAAFGNAGWAGVPGTTGIPSADGQVYSLGQGFTQASGMEGLAQNTFLHEFAHTLYLCPHYFGANRSEGRYFNISEGPGLMGNLRTHFLANAWERWYLGWVELRTGAGRVNSDIQDAASLTATNGEYTLRDYVTEGDVVRIRLPNSTQYLWLENHQYKSALDGRNGYEVGTRQPPNPLRDSPTGILAFVEDIAASRSNVQIGGIVGCNGLKVVSAQGNFDYTKGANLGTDSSYFWHNGTLNDDFYSFTNPVANPFGGESQITRRRIDLNGNNIILTNQHDGNVPYDPHSPQLVTESTRSFIQNNINVGEDGIFGPDAAFDDVGRKMGNSYNPAIFEQQRYDLATAKLAPIKLGGLSVQLIAKDAKTGAITIKVRYDDVNVEQNTRWSGELQMTDVMGKGADVVVNNGKTLTINKSGTNNRHTQLAGEFTNPTTFTCGGGGVMFLQNSGSTVNVAGAKTAFQVTNGGELKLNPYGTTFAVKTGAVLDIQSGGTYTGWYATTACIEAGGTLVVRRGGKLQGGGGLVQVQAGAYLCIEPGADLTSAGLTLDVSPGAIIGANPALGLGALNCSSQLNFCGALTGGNPNLSNICLTGNEALLFDGIDDVVTVPYATASPIHDLGQAFTVEATIRADYTLGATQTIFTNRYTDAGSNVKGLLFSLHNGRYLLCQLEGSNYFSTTDPGMRLSASGGCHQIAVSRDATNRLRFYIDGVAAAYSPVTTRSPASTAAVCFGYDANFPSEGFIGQIGEMRVWNTARSDAEINQYKAATLASPQNGLIGYYDMQGNSGQYVLNASKIQNGGYATPHGYLGSTDAAEANDPTWVLGANLTCNVDGNFRLAAARKMQPDTTGRGGRQPFRNVQSSSTTKHLSQLTIAPNPASGEATLHVQLRDAGQLEVRIQDMMGVARATALPVTTLTAGAHDVKLPLQKLPPGLYLVIVNSADGREVIRLDVK